MKVSSIFMIAVVALLAVAGVASAKRSSTLPKEFPYAAEIQARIEYDGTYSIKTAGYQSCGVTADGHDINKPAGAEDTLHIQRDLYFSHITVPVATPKELGASVWRLGIKPTVTTQGKIEDDHSSMDMEYTTTEGENEECHSVTGACHWEVIPLPSSALETFAAHDNGFLPVSWGISVLGVNTVEGQCPVEDGTEEMSTLLEDAGTLYPPDLEEGFPEVILSGNVGEHLHRLQKADKVHFKVNLATPFSGPTTCPLNAEEEESCTHGVTGTAIVTLHRLSLYRTKQAYPK